LCCTACVQYDPSGEQLRLDVGPQDFQRPPVTFERRLDFREHRSDISGRDQALSKQAGKRVHLMLHIKM